MDPKLRVFISYGHDEHVVFAERLKYDLAACGHEVWFDIDRLSAGHDWDAYIEEGLEWVSQYHEKGRLLLLMTPHSVRRPDGYCLNELARALTRKVPVLPVMVALCEPPLSICRLQWFDMTDCVPLAIRDKKYLSKFPQLVTALEQGHAVPLLSQPRQANRLSGLLALASFTHEIVAIPLTTAEGRELPTLEADDLAHVRSLPCSFPVGTQVRLAVRSDRSCHFLLLNISESGEVTCLCPSWFAPEPRLKEGTNHFPQEASCYRAFPLTDPGRECLLAVHSDQPIWLDLMPSDQRVPAAVLGDRQVERLINELRCLERVLWEAFVTYIDVVPAADPSLDENRIAVGRNSN